MRALNRLRKLCKRIEQMDQKIKCLERWSIIRGDIKYEIDGGMVTMKQQIQFVINHRLQRYKRDVRLYRRITSGRI